MSNIEFIGKDQPIAVYSKFRSELAEWKHHNETVVFDYSDPKGNKEARSHIYKMRQSKAAVDKARVAAGKDALEYKRRVDAEGKEIITEIEQLITVHQAPIDEIENKERERTEAHKRAIADICDGGQHAADNWTDLSIDVMRSNLAGIESLLITSEKWQEFTGAAQAAKDRAVLQMQSAIEKREARDAEQAELERMRAEQATREQRERDERIAREAAEKAKAEAEAELRMEREAAEKAKREAEAKALAEKELAEKARKDAEAKAAAEKEAALRREIELKLEKERAERAQAEAENRARQAEAAAAERVRLEEEERKRQEAAELKKREADTKHKAAINNAALKALTANDLLTDAQAMAVIALITKGKVPNIKIMY